MDGLLPVSGRHEEAPHVGQPAGVRLKGLAAGGDEGGFGDGLEKDKKSVGQGEGVFPGLLGGFEEGFQGAVHAVHEFEDSPGLEAGGHPEEGFPVTGMFEGLSPVEGPPVGGDGFFLHGHFDGSGIKKEGGLLTGIGCWNGVSVALQGDETRSGNGGRSHDTGFRGNGRQGGEGFLLQGLPGLFPRGPVDPVFSFPPLPGEFFIQIFQIVKDVNHDEVFPDIPDHSFDTPFFIGPAWSAGIEGVSTPDVFVLFSPKQNV